MKHLIKKIILENRKEKILDFFTKQLFKSGPPYIQKMYDMGVDSKEKKEILTRVFNQPIELGNYSHWKRYVVFDKQGNMLYAENTYGDWQKSEFNDKNKLVYKEDSSGFWYKNEYDERGNKIYYEDSEGEWVKWEFDENNNEIYYEDFSGMIDDRRE